MTHGGTGTALASASFAVVLIVLGPSTARADDWRRAPTDPLYLALGLRAGAGEVLTYSSAFVGSLLLSGRAAVSFGDAGVGLVVRGGFDGVAERLDYLTPAGLYPHVDGWLAVFGMRTHRGFFERGAYLGAGGGVIANAVALGGTLHHPLIALNEWSYIGIDLTCTVGFVGSCAACPTCGCHGSNITIQLGLEIAAFD